MAADDTDAPDPRQVQAESARPESTTEKVAPALNRALLTPVQPTPGRTRVLQPAPLLQEPSQQTETPTVPSKTYGGTGTVGDDDEDEEDVDSLGAGAGSPTARRAAQGMGPLASLGSSGPYQTRYPQSYTGPLKDVIQRGSEEEGIDPAYAMATAERESSFNPASGGTGTIRGMYQMSGGLRSQYGIGLSTDPYVQTRGFGAFTSNLRSEMKRTLGRDPTWAETYTGHHFGGTRAAKMINGQIGPEMPVSAVFTPQELRGNPHIVRAGTVGNLMKQTISDMDRRMARYGGGQPTAQADDQTPDLSSFGESVEETPLPPPSGGYDRNLTPAQIQATGLTPEQAASDQAMVAQDLED